MTMQETIQAFAAMHAMGSYQDLTLAQLKAMCEFASEHMDDLLHIADMQYPRCTICDEPVLTGESEHETCLKKTEDTIAYNIVAKPYDHLAHALSRTDASKTACGEVVDTNRSYAGFTFPCPDCFDALEKQGDSMSESADKRSADVDPVHYINQHTTLRHMTPPFTEPVETIAIDTPRCGCGDEASYLRAGKHFCSECLIESGDLE